MARIFVYNTINLKPGADPKELEDLCRQVNTLFQKVPGCMDAVVGVGTKTETDEKHHLDVQRVGQYATCTTWESREALDAWLNDPEELVSQEMKDRFEKLAELGSPHHYGVVE